MPINAFQAATDVLDRAHALLALDNQPQPPIVGDDIRRMALALGVAAMDTYLHWAIQRVPFDKLSRDLAKVQISFGNLVESGAKSVESRRRGVADRPEVRARNVLNDYLLKKTFQSAREVETAIGLAGVGVGDAFAKMANIMGPTIKPQDLKDRLNQLSHRRNKIVHEGDIARSLRPQSIKHEPITRATVDDDLDWLGRFIGALAAVVR